MQYWKSAAQSSFLFNKSVSPVTTDPEISIGIGNVVVIATDDLWHRAAIQFIPNDIHLVSPLGISLSQFTDERFGSFHYTVFRIADNGDIPVIFF